MIWHSQYYDFGLTGYRAYLYRRAIMKKLKLCAALAYLMNSKHSVLSLFKADRKSSAWP